MQPVLLAGSGVAISIAIGFLAIGISIILKFERPKKWQGYLFFGLSVAFLILWYILWNLSLGLTSQGEEAANVVFLNNDILPLWLSALGTISLALITFIIAILIPWWRKPKFTVEFDNVQPFCRETTLDEEISIEGTPKPVPPKLTIGCD